MTRRFLQEALTSMTSWWALWGDLEKIGQRLQQAQDGCNEAKQKLSSGRGNVLRQAEMLKELGVKPSKSLPPHLLEESDNDATAPVHSVHSTTPAELSLGS